MSAARGPGFSSGARGEHRRSLASLSPFRDCFLGMPRGGRDSRAASSLTGYIARRYRNSDGNSLDSLLLAVPILRSALLWK